MIAQSSGQADTSGPMEFTVRCNLNVIGNRVINVTTCTRKHLPFLLRCEKKNEASQTHRDLFGHVFFH